MKVSCYLSFNGNCRDAMNFYQHCFGGELRLQSVGDSPQSAKMPRKMKEYILQAALACHGFTIFGTDLVGENGLIKGNAVSLLLTCKSRNEISTVYKKLSEKGKQDHPLSALAEGGLQGDLTDKFGNHWILRFTGDQ